MRVSSPASSMRHSSTAVAYSEKSEKLTPRPSHVAPSGYGLPGFSITSLLSPIGRGEDPYPIASFASVRGRENSESAAARERARAPRDAKGIAPGAGTAHPKGIARTADAERISAGTGVASVAEGVGPSTARAEGSTADSRSG